MTEEHPRRRSRDHGHTRQRLGLSRREWLNVTIMVINIVALIGIYSGIHELRTHLQDGQFIICTQVREQEHGSLPDGCAKILHNGP